MPGWVWALIAPVAILILAAVAWYIHELWPDSNDN